MSRTKHVHARKISHQPLLSLALALIPVGIGAIAAPSALHAQQTTATVVGNVLDASGAVVVGAKVVARNTATNAARETVSDGSGQYTLPALPAGNYILSVEATGFSGQRTEPIVLESSQTARQDFTVTSGKVTEEVQVTATNATAQLQVENGGLGEVIDAKKIEDLPLNGRNFIQPDSLSQFRVDTSSNGPESGAAAGANVNAIIKSGGNKYHGTLWS